MEAMRKEAERRQEPPEKRIGDSRSMKSTRTVGRWSWAWRLAVAMVVALSFGCGQKEDPQEESAEPKAVDPVQKTDPAAIKADTQEPKPTTPTQSLPPDFANYTETIPGTKVTFDMIAVPGGTFVMGSAKSEAGRKDDEGPAHEVTVGPFWVGKAEVTWDEYDAFRDACPGLPKGTPESDEAKLEDVDGVTGPTTAYGDPYRGFSGGKQPAVGISWHAAMTHCVWVSKVTGKFYRLPTEAEWELACRAGSKGSFCFGDDAANLDEYAWHKGNSSHQPHKVATKKPNAWGIYDMHGNVSEWCLDWYQADFYASIASGKWPPDPRGPQKGLNHAIRGGMFEGDALRLRCASRDRSQDWWLTLDPQEPKSKWWHVPTNFLGFRVVRPLKEEKPPVRESRRGL